MIDHVHIIGIRGVKKGRGRYYLGCGCGKLFNYLDAMLYIEHYFGDVEGRKYWIELRNRLEQFTREKRKGSWMEGWFYPGDF